jgi:glutathione peroxidase
MAMTGVKSILRRHATLAFGLLLLSSLPTLAACPALLQQTLPRLQDEKPVNLCEFAGKVVVVVNTASQCGFTPQYKSLEALNDRYRARGLVVLGFPANNFGSQEPGSNTEIAEFCENQFAVHFPMFAKSSVLKTAKAPANPLFAALSARTGQPPKWNFHKYIVDRRGDIVISHDSEVDPLDPIFVKDIERLLAAKQ